MGARRLLSAAVVPLQALSAEPSVQNAPAVALRWLWSVVLPDGLMHRPPLIDPSADHQELPTTLRVVRVCSCAARRAF
jgi:hypothetical protein